MVGSLETSTVVHTRPRAMVLGDRRGVAGGDGRRIVGLPVRPEAVGDPYSGAWLGVARSVEVLNTPMSISVQPSTKFVTFVTKSGT